MALKPCPECKKVISTHARFCPHCGFAYVEEVHRERTKMQLIHDGTILLLQAGIIIGGLIIGLSLIVIMLKTFFWLIGS